METVTNRPSFEKCEDRKILGDFLKMKFIDEKATFVSYAECDAVVGRKLQGENWYIMVGARADVEKEYQVMFAVVRSKGLQLSRSYSGKMLGTMASLRKRIRRTTKTVVNAASMDPEISDEEKIRLNTALSVAGALELCSRKSSFKKIEARVNEQQGHQIATAESLRLFAK